jgi:hypothetical protein
MSHDERVRRAAAAINAAIEDYRKTEGSGGITAIVNLIKQVLKTEGLIVRQRWPPNSTGVHPSNRGGIGLLPVDVHELLSFIALAHWSWDEVANALAVEINPTEGADSRSECINFNVKLTQASNGLLPPAEMDEMKIVTLTCGHTTATLRCVLGGARSTHTDLSQDGKLSLAKLSAKNEGMAEAAKIGLQYDVIPWKVDQACPGMCALLIEADNLKHRAAREDSDWQVIMQMHNQIKMIELPTEDDWRMVAANVGRYKPKHKEQCSDFELFVRECS